MSAAEYLQRFDPQLFPPYFGRLLHPFLGSLATLEPDARVAAIEAEFDRLAAVRFTGQHAVSHQSTVCNFVHIPAAGRPCRHHRGRI